MKTLFWALVFAAVAVGAWQLYLRHQREALFAGTVYYRDGEPLESNGQVGAPPSAHLPPPAQDTRDTSENVPTATANSMPIAPAATASSATANDKAAARAGFTPTPPTGVAFAGAGGFQWYRQGDLTWRLNLENGASCVAFATPEAWQKPNVFRHGCGPV